MPAEKAGMKLGDEIIDVDGKPIAGLAAMIESLKRTQAKPIQITVKRDGQLLNFTVQPVLDDIRGDQRYRVGIGSAPMKVSSLPFAAAFRRSVEQNKQGSLLILELVQKMIQRKISIQLHRGPHRHRTRRRTGRQQERLDAPFGTDRGNQLESGHL